MMFFKSALTLSTLLVLASAMALERSVPAHEQMSILMATDAQAGRAQAPSFTVSGSSDCEQEDENDCTEFCSLLEQTATCRANGNKVTCFCKGGKSESNCEERCLLCMPDKSALEEASRIFKLGGPRIEEL